jgi:hypothetical protein
MIGLFSLLAALVIGAGVATFDAREDESWEAATAVATAGAIAGADIGGWLGFSVAFGAFPGFIWAIVGAVLFVRVYRSQILGATPPTATRAREHVAPAAPEHTSPVAPIGIDSTQPSESLFGVVAEAFGWGTICAFPTAGGGFFGHLLGSSIYPQPYEQIPSDFLFIPLGMFVGFVAAGIARIARRDWRAPAMMSVVAVVTIVYGVAMFQYSRIHAMPAGVTATLEPDVITAIPCAPETCAATDPPSQWYVIGRLRMKPTRLGVAIDRMEITSDTNAEGPVTPQRNTKERAQEAARWRGPRVVLTGRRIPGPRRLEPDVESTYTITYPYHTRDGSSRRTVLISVYMADAAGNATYAGASWQVK